MFGFFKRRAAAPKSTSKADLAIQIASTIDAFIDVAGIEEFEKDRLSVVIYRNNTVSISEASSGEDVVLSVRLKSLGLEPIGIAMGGAMRHRLIDMAAISIFRKLPT